MGLPLTLRIYLEDTDAGGIVYHASYLRFMERARTEMLREAGFEQSTTFQTDVSFVVHSMNLRFVAAAKLDDRVLVSCHLGRARGASLVFAQAVHRLAEDGSDSVPLCTADVTVACVQLSDQRPRRVPGDLVERIQALAERGHHYRR
jgi:4-hydroxybenzoyl-CoA thioesterase